MPPSACETAVGDSVAPAFAGVPAAALGSSEPCRAGSMRRKSEGRVLGRSRRLWDLLVAHGGWAGEHRHRPPLAVRRAGAVVIVEPYPLQLDDTALDGLPRLRCLRATRAQDLETHPIDCSAWGRAVHCGAQCSGQSTKRARSRAAQALAGGLVREIWAGVGEPDAAATVREAA